MTQSAYNACTTTGRHQHTEHDGRTRGKDGEKQRKYDVDAERKTDTKRVERGERRAVVAYTYTFSRLLLPWRRRRP